MNADRHHFLADAVAVEEGLGVVAAIGNLANLLAHVALGLVPALVDAGFDLGPAVTADELLEAPLGQAAAGDLRFEIAESVL